ncbi:MAG: hypothetical protein QXS72_08160, partial [Candidatus Caldarchaeum sp.]
TKTMTALITLLRETSDERLKNDINTLMRKLKWLKSRDLALWLSDLHHAAQNYPPLLQLAPTAAQLEEWFSRDDD